MDNEELAKARALLQESPLFTDIPPEEIEAACLHLVPVTFAPGDEIVRARELGDRCYFIESGHAQVVSDDLIGEETHLSDVGRGVLIGEIALLKDVLRVATVRAVSSVNTYMLDRDSFLLLAVRVPRLVGRLRDRIELVERRSFLRRASPLARLSIEVTEEVARSLREVQVQAGERIIKEGEKGDCFFLIRSGRLEVRRAGQQKEELGIGDYFGEMALLSNRPRNATVWAREDSVLLALRRPEFNRLVGEHPHLRAHVCEMAYIRNGGVTLPECADIQPTLPVYPLPTERGPFWFSLVVGLALFIALSILARQTNLPALSVAVLFVGALVGPVSYVVYLASTNIFTRQPLRLAVTFLIAAVVVYPAAEAEIAVGAMSSSSLYSALAYGSIEEVVKVIAVVWLMERREMRFRMDGVIYGAAAGMGFAAFETLLYGTQHLSTVPALLDVLWLRALLSPFTHGTWTAIVCAAIWQAKRGGPPRLSWRVPMAFAVSIALHTAWDLSPPFYLFYYYLAVGAIGLAILTIVVQLALAEQARPVIILNGSTVDYDGAKRATMTCWWWRCRQVAPPGSHYCPRCGRALRL